MASKRASFVVTSCRDLQHAAVNQIKCLFLNESGELQEGMFSLKKTLSSNSVCCFRGLMESSNLCLCIGFYLLNYTRTHTSNFFGLVKIGGAGNKEVHMTSETDAAMRILQPLQLKQPCIHVAV